jgi:DMSO/TMAO reductase YedYZ molybdopterin-dependent catalytic subunit
MSLFRADPRTQETRPDGRKRLPPGQRLTDGWPVLHYGSIPQIDLATWRLTSSASLRKSACFTWDEFMALPQPPRATTSTASPPGASSTTSGRACASRTCRRSCAPKPEAKHVIFHSYGGYTTNVPLDELQGPENMLVHTHTTASR